MQPDPTPQNSTHSTPATTAPIKEHIACPRRPVHQLAKLHAPGAAIAAEHPTSNLKSTAGAEPGHTTPARSAESSYEKLPSFMKDWVDRASVKYPAERSGNIDMATDAHTIADTLKTRANLRAYHQLPEGLQIRLVPNLVMEYSGFTHSYALGFADAYLRSLEQAQRGPLARLAVDLKDYVARRVRRMMT